jgi:ATP-dependent DNA helicase RecG
MEDPVPKDILEKYNLPNIKTALFWIHTPKTKSDGEVAKKRFAFEEIFYIQIQKQIEKTLWQKQKSFTIKIQKNDVDDFIKDFPFTATNAQLKVIDTIKTDLLKTYPMARLLEGDVGSGKTAVGAVASFMVSKNSPEGKKNERLQTAYMAPTEILSIQLFENFIKFFKEHKLSVGLLTSSGARKFPAKTKSKDGEITWTKISKAQLKKWVLNGEVDILIGTHSLIQKTVQFKNLALVIIDEQHRFGTAQRQKLLSKGGLTPHLLSMTATPIPRTLALTIFGDLDLSVLDELPKGRLPVLTEIVFPNKRDETYEFIRSKLKEGRQLYVICPRIDEPDESNENALLLKSVKSEALRLKKDVFKDFNIEILHGAMTPKEKEETMIRFLEKKIDILVATSVVEVGVSVSNATMIIIEGAERFGLSQLHQLRGRVQRGSYQPYCFVFTESNSPKTKERLKALKLAKNGFELAEFDLKQRGAGDLVGVKQWGVTDLAMEAIKNIKMVEFAKEEAKKIIEEDFELKKYPIIKKGLVDKVHLE